MVKYKKMIFPLFWRNQKTEPIYNIVLKFLNEQVLTSWELTELKYYLKQFIKGTQEMIRIFKGKPQIIANLDSIIDGLDQSEITSYIPIMQEKGFSPF